MNSIWQNRHSYVYYVGKRKLKYIRAPFTHQHESVLFCLKHPRCALFSEPGTGKTKIVVDTARHHLKSKKRFKDIDKVLIVAPLCVLWTWEQEIKVDSNYKSVVVYGTAKERIKLLQDKKAKFFIINYDALTIKALFPALLKKKFKMVVFDESIKLKNAEIKRTKRAYELAKEAASVIIMSGRPVSGDAGDIFGQYLVLDGGDTFGKNLYRFRHIFFRRAPTPFPKWELKTTWNEATQKHEPTALRYIKWAVYKKAISFTKAQCLDLPPKIFKTYHAVLSNEQVAAQEKLGTKGLLELGSEKLTIKNVLNLCTKERQITAGFLYSPQRVFDFPSNPKLEVLRDLIHDEYPGEKLVVVCAFHRGIDLVRSILPAPSVEISGRIKDKEAARRQFQEDPETRYAVAQISAGSLGISLTAAAVMVFFSMNYSLSDYLQMLERIHRPGQVKPCTYIHLAARNSVDEEIMEAIRRKKNISDFLLEKAHEKLISNSK